jgi:hypothetical protein
MFFETRALYVEAPEFEIERNETDCSWIDVGWDKYPHTGIC